MKNLKALLPAYALVIVGLLMATPVWAQDTTQAPPVEEPTTEEADEQDIISTLEAEGNFTMFLDALEQTGLAEELRGQEAAEYEGEEQPPMEEEEQPPMEEEPTEEPVEERAATEGESYTVFAPNDEAFAALAESGELNMEDPEALAEILRNHIVVGKVKSADATEQGTLETIQGGTLTVEGSETDATVNEASIVESDIEASNGVIHVVDGVLVPAEEPATSE